MFSGTCLATCLAGGRHGPQRGRDGKVEVTLDLVAAARGVTKTVTVHREELCPDAPATVRGAAHGRRRANVAAATARRFRIRVFFGCNRPAGHAAAQGTVVTDPCPSAGRGRVKAKRVLEVTIPPGVDTGTPSAFPAKARRAIPARRAATSIA